MSVKQSVMTVSAVITRLVFTKRIKQKGVSGAESRVLSASCDCWCKSCRQSVDYSDRVISFSSSPPTALQTFPIINGTCIYLMSVCSERMLSELVGQSVSASAPSLSQVRAWSSTAVISLGMFLNNKISYPNSLPKLLNCLDTCTRNLVWPIQNICTLYHLL